MIRDYFILAVRNLQKRKLRSWLTMLGIFISIATIFLLVSLSLGLQGAVQEQFRLLGTDKIFVQPGTGFLGPPGSVGGTILTEDDARVVEKVSGVKRVVEMVAGNAKVEYNDEIRYFPIYGVSIDSMDLYFESSAIKIDEGTSLNREGSKKVLLGYDFKYNKLFEKPVTAGSKININGVNFKVGGIMSQIGNPSDDQNIIMDLVDFRNLVNSTGKRVDIILVQVESGADVKEVSERINKKLINYRHVDEKTKDFMISTPEELLQSFQTILNIITIFLAGIAGISLVVGAIGIANTMYTSVLERTREIGVMKAIGARNSDVMWIFLIESGLLGMTGAIIGVLLGILGSKLVEFIAINYIHTTLLRAAIPVYLIVGCLAFGFLVGAISGTLPAIRASRTNVVDALRYE